MNRRNSRTCLGKVEARFRGLASKKIGREGKMSKVRAATVLAVVTLVISFSGAVSATNYIIYVGGDCSKQWPSKANRLYADQFHDGSVLGSNTNGVVCGYPTPTPIPSCNTSDPNVWVNEDAAIDNTSDPWTSMAELANVLNSYCSKGSGKAAYSYTAYHAAGSCKTYACYGKFGCTCATTYTTATPYTVNVPAVPDDTCVIVNHSGSDNVVRLLFATYDDLWNTRAVYTSAGAGGGSELASAMYLYGSIDAGPYLSDTDPPATCNFTWWMDVDTARSGYGLGRWAWDDTNGTSIYHLADGGCLSGQYTYDPSMPSRPGYLPICNFFPGTSDGAVAYHSSLGRADVGTYINFEDEGPNGNYYGHYTWGDGYPDEGINLPNGVNSHDGGKRLFFSADYSPTKFVSGETACDAFSGDPSLYCHAASAGGNGYSWYDAFLNGLAGEGWCYGVCGNNAY
jgi:hypothetical protein